jgi:hypothetical protein
MMDVMKTSPPQVRQIVVSVAHSTSDESSENPSSQRSLIEEVTQKFSENVMRVVEAVSGEDDLFKNSPIGTETKTVFVYAAVIRNMECHCAEKCGKVKVGYMIGKEMHMQHICRLSHMCPSFQLHWYKIEVGNYSNISQRELGKKWESEIGDIIKVPSLLSFEILLIPRIISSQKNYIGWRDKILSVVRWPPWVRRWPH